MWCHVGPEFEPQEFHGAEGASKFAQWYLQHAAIEPTMVAVKTLESFDDEISTIYLSWYSTAAQIGAATEVMVLVSGKISRHIMVLDADEESGDSGEENDET